MPKRALGALRNLQGYATHNTRKTTLHKIQRNQSIAIPLPKGKENKAPVRRNLPYPPLIYLLLLTNQKPSPSIIQVIILSISMRMSHSGHMHVMFLDRA